MATKVLTLRLESEVFRSVCVFQHTHRLESTSDAIRTLLEIAMRDVQQLDAAFRKAAWDSGTKSAAKKLSENLQGKLDRAVAECLGVNDTEIAR